MAARLAKNTPRRKRVGKPATRYAEGGLVIDAVSLTEATARLLALDPDAIGAMIAAAGPPPSRLRPPSVESLVAIVVSQQVSVASAEAIFARLAKALSPIDASRLCAADDALMRSCGLSSPKMRALRALGEAIREGDLPFDQLCALGAQKAYEALVGVKGIGPWTADIFLLFCLGYADAFPSGDLALQEAARLVLKRKSRPDARALERIAERWRPYRGVAARLLWAYYRVVKGREAVASA
jgi:DNA-3-methyladenine glycosylase II